MKIGQRARGGKEYWLLACFGTGRSSSGERLTKRYDERTKASIGGSSAFRSRARQFSRRC